MGEQISYEQSEARAKRPITIEYRYIKATGRYSLGAVRTGEMSEERFFGTYQQMIQAVEAVNPGRKVISI